VNVLDENILESQRQLLRGWRIPIRQIGFELCDKGTQDEEIIPFLLTVSQPTLFTRDLGFYDRRFRHERYCLAILAVGQYEAAHFIRRFLNHRDFNTRAKRMGTVVRAMQTGLVGWRLHAHQEFQIQWSA